MQISDNFFFEFSNFTFYFVVLVVLVVLVVVRIDVGQIKAF
jgi:hypothetical protein